MKIFKNILFGLVGYSLPPIGIIGSIIKYISSETNNPGRIFLLEIASSILNNNPFTSIAQNFIVESIENNNLKKAIKNVLPENMIECKCSSCSSYGKDYVLRSGLIMCGDCLEKDISKLIYGRQIIYHPHNIETMYETFIYNNKLLGYNIKGEYIKTQNIKGKWI